MLRFLLILLFLGTNAYAQSLGISPNSYNLWGNTKGISEVFVEYKFAGLHYFHNWDEQKYRFENTDEVVSKTSSLALSVIPVDFKYFRSGVVVFHKKFPITNSSHVHFLLEACLPIRRFTISYRHISNGFGLLHDINPGVDSFSLKYNFSSE